MGYPHNLGRDQDRTAPVLRQIAGRDCIRWRRWLGGRLCAPRRGGKSHRSSFLLSRRQNGGRGKRSTRPFVPLAIVFVDGNSSPSDQYVVSVIRRQDRWLGSFPPLAKSS